MDLIDSHIHLDDWRFDDNRQQLVTAAKACGIKQFIVPAVTRKGFDKLLSLAQQYTECKVALGLHPYFLKEHQTTDLAILDELLTAHSNVIAVGECGLDFFLPDLDKDRQIYFLDRQIELAKKHDLPLILHVRKAVEQVFGRLKFHNYFRAVMHSFNGSVEQAKQICEHGIKLGFGAAAANPKAKKLQRLVASVPDECILLETDAPDQPFFDRRGQLNRPQDLLRVCQQLAAIRGVSVETLADLTTANTKEFFNL